MSVKALAERVLQGNRQGNREETKSFLIPENRKPEMAPRETLPFGLTLADLGAEFSHDPDWPKIKNDPRWLHFLAETIHHRRHRQDDGKKRATTADTRTADRLTPAERSRWCLAHELTRPGHLCQNKNRLEGCTLWEAVKGKQTLPTIADSIHHGGV